MAANLYLYKPICQFQETFKLKGTCKQRPCFSAGMENSHNCKKDRVHTLIINNLAASSLWHHLACVDPTLYLLSDIQNVLVDFFGGEKPQWVSQSVLFFIYGWRRTGPYKCAKLSRDDRPQWRALYKPTLPERGCDIQWRILHGVIAVNAFVTVLNPEICPDCPFCSQRKIVFHAFMYCERLKPLYCSNLKSFLKVF